MKQINMKIALNRNVLLVCATLLLMGGIVYIAKKPLISGNGNSAAVSLSDNTDAQELTGDITVTNEPDVVSTPTIRTNQVREEGIITTPELHTEPSATPETSSQEVVVATLVSAPLEPAKSTKETPVVIVSSDSSNMQTGGSGLTGASLGGGSGTPAPAPVAPSVSIGTTVQPNYATSTLALSGTATDNSIVTVRTISSAYGTTTATTTAVSGAWSLTQVYPHGPVTIEVKATLGGLDSTIVNTATSFTYVSTAPVVAGKYTKAESPYVLDSIPFGTVDNPVTIEPGTVIKLRAGGKIDGTTCADRCVLRIGDNSSTEQVVITSITDDSVLGDTNENGSSSGSPYDWNGITLGGNAELYIQNAVLKFGGNTVVTGGKLEISSTTLTSYGLDIVTFGAASVTLNNQTIVGSISGDGSATSVLAIQNSRIVGGSASFSGFANYEITNNQFTGPSSVIDISNAVSTNISGNTTENAIELIVSDTAPTFTDNSFIYRLRASFIGALQAESGSVLKLPAGGILGSLDTIEVRGDASNPVTVYQDHGDTYGEPFGVTPITKIGCVDLVRDGVHTQYGSCVAPII